MFYKEPLFLRVYLLDISDSGYYEQHTADPGGPAGPSFPFSPPVPCENTKVQV